MTIIYFNLKMQFLLLSIMIIGPLCAQVYLPISCSNRNSLKEVKLTPIGDYGILRKSRLHVPAHYHTGIDIQRPSSNYINEPIYPASDGIVISKRDDGPYAQLIIEHHYKNFTFWTLYEHIAGITVNVGDQVSFKAPIGRFMSKNELNKHGWQFDHLHFEILKVKPLPIKPDHKNPQRRFNGYNLVCNTPEDLSRFYYNPSEFFIAYCNRY